MLKVIVDDYSVEQLLNYSPNLWSTWGEIFDNDKESTSFFSHQRTVKAWLSTLPKDMLLKISLLLSGETIVGIMLLGDGSRPFLRYFKISTLRPLRTGFHCDDQWWPEYVAPISYPFVGKYKDWWISETLKKTKTSVFEMEAIPTTWLPELEVNKRLLHVIENRSESGIVELSGDLTWSRSVRRQLKQTEAFATKKDSPIWFEEITENKYEFVSKYCHWHIDKWAQSPTPSGFENPQFNALFEKLLSNEATHSVRVFSAMSKSGCVGFQIVLTHEGWAGFYLASLKPEGNTNHWHIGIWLHIQVAERLKQEGFSEYDFMAGEANYKKRLSSKARCFVRVVLFNRRNKLLNLFKNHL